jgi:hypothetical protein
VVSNLLNNAAKFTVEGDKRLSREAGFDGHLVKPVDLKALLTLIGSLVP